MDVSSMDSVNVKNPVQNMSIYKHFSNNPYPALCTSSLYSNPEWHFRTDSVTVKNPVQNMSLH